MRSARPLILFDGVCNLCDASVRWVLEHDRKNQFDFASLQSQAATRALAEAGDIGTPAMRLDGVVLIDEDGVAVGAEAVLRVVRRLGFPWSVAGIARLLPAAARRAIYAWIARHRYRWFGKRTACAMPTPELQSRFLDAHEPRWVEPEKRGQVTF